MPASELLSALREQECEDDCDDDDDDGDDIERDTCSFSEANACIQKLKTFALTNGQQSTCMLKNVMDLEETMSDMAFKQIKQPKISSFFNVCDNNS